MVLMLEIGRVDRFPTAAHLASYAGLVPRVHSSGGHTRMGQEVYREPHGSRHVLSSTHG